MTMMLTQGAAIIERLTRLEIGSGFILNQVQDASGVWVTQLDVPAGSGITQGQADLRYLQLTGGTLTGDLNISSSGVLQMGGTTIVSAARVLQNVTTDASIIATGTLADARLSGNVPLKNALNTFSLANTFSAGVTLGGNLTFTGATARIIPGLTNFAINNNAGTQNNLLIDDAGAVTLRSTLGGITTLTATTLSIIGAGSHTIGPNAGAAVALQLNSAAGNLRDYRWLTGGVLRWASRADSSTETGVSNAGSNYQLNAYDDTGVFIDTPFSVVRTAGGTLNLTRPVVAIGPTTGTSLSVLLRAATATTRGIYWQTGSVNRWALYANSTAESTGDLGTDLALSRYTDAGAFVDNVWSVRRSTGDITYTHYGIFSIDMGLKLGSGPQGTFGATGFHDAVAMSTNLQYVSADPTAAANWTYIRAAGVNNIAGSTLLMRGNATETGVSLAYYSAPTSTGVGVAPASLTMRWQVTSALMQVGSGVAIGMSGTTILTSARVLQNVTTDASILTAGTVPSARLTGSYTGITGLGTITVGAWSASTIGTGVGGTGLTSYTTGDMIYSSAGSTLAKLAGNTATTHLYLMSVGDGVLATAPQWSALDASYITSGTLSADHGGTGFASFTLGQVLYANSTTTLARLAPNTTAVRQYLAQTGTGAVSAAPIWQTIDATDIGSGTIAGARISGSYTGITGVGTLTVGTWSASTIGTTRGGTGLTAYTTGDLIYSSAGNTLSKLSGNTAASRLFLRSQGSGGLATAPVWDTIDGSDISSGFVDELFGGTGLTTYTLGDTLYSSASNTLAKLAGNTTSTRKYLAQTGTGAVSAAPAWTVISFSDITGGGVIPVISGGTGLTAYVLGDTLYGDAGGALSILNGNLTTTKKYLTQTGTGTGSAVPVWNPLAAADIPSLDTAKITTGTFASARLSGSYTGITGLGTLASLTVSGAINASSSIIMGTTQRLYFDGGSDSYMLESAANVVDINTGGALRVRFKGGSWTVGGWGNAIELPNAAVLKWAGNTNGYRFGMGQTNGAFYFMRSNADDTSGPSDYWLSVDEATLNATFQQNLLATGYIRSTQATYGWVMGEVSSIQRLRYDTGTGIFTFLNAGNGYAHIAAGVGYFSGNDRVVQMTCVAGNSALTQAIDGSTAKFSWGWSGGTAQWVIYNDALSATAMTVNVSNNVVTFAQNVTAANFTLASDIRLKENITRIPNALQRVEKLDGVYFNFIDKTRGVGRKVGVIAQQVQEVLPEAVSQDNDGYLLVDYDALIPLLIEAVKEEQRQRKQIFRQLQQERNEVPLLP